MKPVKPEKIVIVSGERGAGKTSLAGKLLAGIRAKGLRAGGIITISEPTARYEPKQTYSAQDIISGEFRPLLHSFIDLNRGSSPKTVRAGRFFLDLDTLSWAVARIDEASDRADVLIIDELGPLELEGDGYFKTVASILRRFEGILILVIRNGLAETLCRKLHIDLAGLFWYQAEESVHDSVARFIREVLENE